MNTEIQFLATAGISIITKPYLLLRTVRKHEECEITIYVAVLTPSA
jgi:hypothetical protein